MGSVIKPSFLFMFLKSIKMKPIFSLTCCGEITDSTKEFKSFCG